jgi:hypothetical protein
LNVRFHHDEALDSEPVADALREAQHVGGDVDEFRVPTILTRI